MRIAWLAVASIVALGCKGDPAPERKVRKFEVKPAVDDRGRLKLAFRLYDAKHEPMGVAGSYTGEIAKLDGTVLCKAEGKLAPGDFREKGTHQAPWHDATCPLDPGADELKVNVTLVAMGQGDKGKDGKPTDRSFERSMTLPIKSIYERPPVKKPAEAPAKPAEAAKPPTAEKPEAVPAKPAETPAKPAEVPAKPAEAPAKPAEAPAAAGSGSNAPAAAAQPAAAPSPAASPAAR